MRALSIPGSDPLPINKTDSRAVVDALDTWTNSNASTINTTIPQPARGVLTPGQKAVYFNAVQIARYMVDNPTYLTALSKVIAEIEREINDN
jgi:hypothetical protein